MFKRRKSIGVSNPDRRRVLRNLGLAGAGMGVGAAALGQSGESLARVACNVTDPSVIDLGYDSRSISFENPTGARGAGGKAGRGRKGSPARPLQPGEKVLLADIQGPGTLRHIWMTFPALTPEVNRALRLEVFYDGASEPSISVPVLDFFGLPHGRPVELHSAMCTANEGRGFNSFIPMPFGRSVRVEFTNASTQPTVLFYQIDYTLEPSRQDNTGYLHAAFRRENPTVQRRDFVIAEGLKGPGRFLGCVVGVRVLDPRYWYGEGEVKMYRDGDNEYPTYCGTGLEDYVGSAWGLGTHYALYSGAPLNVYNTTNGVEDATPTFVGFYRWHVPDPIMFARDLRVTVQQIGYASFSTAQADEFARFKSGHPAAGNGWERAGEGDLAWLPEDWIPPDNLAMGVFERSDDYCATAFVYCCEPQPVPRLDVGLATNDITYLLSETEKSPAGAAAEWEGDMKRSDIIGLT